MAAPVSRIMFWLHFCTVRGTGGTLSTSFTVDGLDTEVAEDTLDKHSSLSIKSDTAMGAPLNPTGEPSRQWQPEQLSLSRLTLMGNDVDSH